MKGFRAKPKPSTAGFSCNLHARFILVLPAGCLLVSTYESNWLESCGGSKGCAVVSLIYGKQYASKGSSTLTGLLV